VYKILSKKRQHDSDAFFLVLNKCTKYCQKKRHTCTKYCKKKRQEDMNEIGAMHFFR
jgi:hypothetical protein